MTYFQSTRIHSFSRRCLRWEGSSRCPRLAQDLLDRRALLSQACLRGSMYFRRYHARSSRKIVNTEYFREFVCQLNVQRVNNFRAEISQQALFFCIQKEKTLQAVFRDSRDSRFDAGPFGPESMHNFAQQIRPPRKARRANVRHYIE